MFQLLLATDLDRTLLPNGDQPESEQARPTFRKFTEHEGVTLAYISGRSKHLLQEAITEYDLPVPHYAIGDVGSTIYQTYDGSWQPLEAWQEKISMDWNGYSHRDLAEMFADIDVLELQETSKQNDFKLSYYAPEDTDRNALLSRMQEKLDTRDVEASLIWSIDEQTHTGLLDVLPKSATKLDALVFLCRHLDFPKERTVFCGDSGNDMPALTSGMQAVLVANARQDVKDEALQNLQQNNLSDTLFIAQGDFLGMNGNYGAGVLEGVAHYFPECKAYMV